MTDHKPGDRVLVRAEVIDDSHPTDLLLEFFSKTDQWNGWVRTDLILPKGAIVLDLDSAFPADVVANLMKTAAFATFTDGSPQQAALNSIAHQIEAQTKPPRIPEPGLWGVVRDSTTGAYLTRDRDTMPRWVVVAGNEPGNRARWEDITVPVLIRPGIEDPQ